MLNLIFYKMKLDAMDRSTGRLEKERLVVPNYAEEIHMTLTTFH